MYEYTNKYTNVLFEKRDITYIAFIQIKPIW